MCNVLALALVPILPVDWWNYGALVVVAVLLGEVVVVLCVDVLVNRLVLVRPTDLYVDVGVSSTATVGLMPTVISASPLPCCPSIARTI